MTRKRRRLMFVLGGMLALFGAAALVLNAFEENLLFFYSPSDVHAEKAPPDRAFRLGGLVEEGSLERLSDGKTVRFRVTDGAEAIAVTYSGILPDLFREGQGVVTQGRLGADGEFRADEVLAKHDENYMPKEVADALKAQGHWQGGEETAQ